MPMNVFTTLDHPLAGFTQASGINGAGQIVGFFNANRGGRGAVFRGFLLSGGSFTDFGDPLAIGNDTKAFGINDTGQIVGSYVDGQDRQTHAFFLSGTVFVTIDPSSTTTRSEAHGINNVGQIVGDFSDASGRHGFLRSSAGVF